MARFRACSLVMLITLALLAGCAPAPGADRETPIVLRLE